MAIRIRGVEAIMYLEVVAHEQIVEDGKTLWEIVMVTVEGNDADEVIIKTGWRGALGEFEIGTRVGVHMNRARPREAGPAPQSPSPAAKRYQERKKT